jgi:hypothetical protein
MAAYNNHRNLHYDIVVFTTLPVSQIDEADFWMARESGEEEAISSGGKKRLK